MPEKYATKLAWDVDSASKHYGDVKALDNVNLSIVRGVVTGLIGANGSGKSTLMRLLAGVETPSSGKVEFDAGHHGQKIAANSIESGVGAFIDGFGLWQRWTVAANLRYLARLCGIDIAKADEVMVRYRISQHASRKVRALSLGNRQRLGVATADLIGHNAVILDEPLSGLDPDMRVSIRDDIRTMTESGRTVLLSSHDLPEIQGLCQELIVLAEGKTVFHGKLRDYLGNKNIVVVYADTADFGAVCALLKSAGIRALIRGLTIRCSDVTDERIRLLLADYLAHIRIVTQPMDLEDSFHDNA